MVLNWIRQHQHVFLMTLVILLVFSMLLAITQGSVKIPFRHVVDIIIGIENEAIKPNHDFIVTQVRLPRIVLSAAVGGALSVIGVAFQAIFRNPMADPYVMGVSSGAAFGATVGIVLGLGKGIFGLSMVSTLAFVGAITTVWIVYSLAKVGNKVSTTGILLAGIIANALLSSLISMMMLLYHNDIDKIVTWTMGSFNAASWNHLKTLILPLGMGIVILLSHTRELNALLMGDEEAHNIGVNVQKTKKILLITSAFIAAFAVSTSGIIGFVGLVVPHTLRLIVGSNHKYLLPVSFFGGAWFLLICDTMARSMIPNMEVPVGIITSIIGGPFFLMLLQKHKKNMV